jgi:hypothetical protein
VQRQTRFDCIAGNSLRALKIPIRFRSGHRRAECPTGIPVYQRNDDLTSTPTWEIPKLSSAQPKLCRPDEESMKEKEKSSRLTNTRVGRHIFLCATRRSQMLFAETGLELGT